MIKEEFEELLTEQFKRSKRIMPNLHVTQIHEFNGQQYGLFSDSSGKIEVYHLLPTFRIKQVKDPALADSVIKDLTQQ